MSKGMLRAFIDGMQFEQLIASIGKFDVRDVVAAFEDDHVAQTAYYRIWRCVVSSGFSRNDAWLMNMMLGQWELARGETVCKSYPIDVVIPIADICNARCKFCGSWRDGRGVLSVEQVDDFASILRHAHFFGYQGHGEPLVNPHIDEVIGKIASHLDPRCRSYIITNGKLLNAKLDLLLKAQLTDYSISLNAATAQTHEKMMCLGRDAFDDILSAIRRLVALRREARRWYLIGITMVLVRDNLEDAPDFIRLGNELGVDTIRVNALAPFGDFADKPDLYTDLSPAHDPRLPGVLSRLGEEVGKSKANVIWYPEHYGNKESWPAGMSGQEFNLERSSLSETQLRQGVRNLDYDTVGCGEILGEPETDGPNPWGRRAPLRCHFPYTHFMCTGFDYRLPPCCYMPEISGTKPIVHDPRKDFHELWNAPAYQRLRKHLRDGPLLNACKLCPAMSS